MSALTKDVVGYEVGTMMHEASNLQKRAREDEHHHALEVQRVREDPSSSGLLRSLESPGVHPSSFSANLYGRISQDGQLLVDDAVAVASFIHVNKKMKTETTELDTDQNIVPRSTNDYDESLSAPQSLNSFGEKEGTNASQPKKVNNEQWDAMFARLVQYKEKHGDCLVPKRYADDPKLGTWVETQRVQYKRLPRTLCEQSGTELIQTNKRLNEERLAKLLNCVSDNMQRYVVWCVVYGHASRACACYEGNERDRNPLLHPSVGACVGH
jgi:hypothetical protein